MKNYPKKANRLAEIEHEIRALLSEADDIAAFLILRGVPTCPISNEARFLWIGIQAMINAADPKPINTTKQNPVYQGVKEKLLKRVTENWAKKKPVLSFLKKGVLVSEKRTSVCPICGKEKKNARLRNKGLIFDQIIIHYLNAHNVRPSKMVVDYIGKELKSKLRKR